MDKIDGQMKMQYVFNGDHRLIPDIGSRIQIEKYVYFKVEAYGESQEVPEVTYDGGKPGYAIELLGCLVVPAGSPLEVLENLLGGKL